MILAATAAGQTVRLVDDSATGGANDGTSWPDAYTSLDTALGAASPGDTILVAHGTYVPSVPRDTTDPRSSAFELEPDISVIGGFQGLSAPPGTTPSTAPANPDGSPRLTILSGDRGTSSSSDNCYNVVFASGDSTQSLQSLSRLTVQDGNANGTNGLSPDFDYQTNGGGVYTSRLPGTGGGRLRLDECILKDNYAAEHGGAVFFAGGSNTDSFFGAVQCFVEDNEAGEHGGGFSLERLGALPEHVAAFEDENLGTVNAGSFIMNCTFFDNEAGSASTLLTSAGGGAVWVEDMGPTSTFQMGNNRAAGNVARGHGGAFAFASLFSGPLNVANNTIFGNLVTETDGDDPSAVFFEATATPTAFFRNNIVWGNRGAKSTSDPQTVMTLLELGGTPGVATRVTAEYNDIQTAGSGTYVGTGNIDADPSFVDVVARDFTLADDSPCIDTGLNSGRTYDLADIDGLNGVTELLPLDFRASVSIPRVINIVDMGAFEQ